MVPLWMIGAGSKITGLAKKIPMRVWLAIGIVLSFWLWGNWQHHKGWQERDQIAKQHQKALESAVATYKSRSERVNNKIRRFYVDKVRTIYVEGKTITREIPKYIPVDTCPLPGGFRVLHDWYASGGPAPSAGRADAAPVEVRAAIETIGNNYLNCRSDIAQVEGLHQYILQQQAAIAELCRQPNVRCSTGK